MGNTEITPSDLHSELSEYSSLLRALRSSSHLDLLSELVTKDVEPNDVSERFSSEAPSQCKLELHTGLMTRWPLAPTELADHGWTLEDEILPIIRSLIDNDDMHLNDLSVRAISLSAVQHIQSILACIAAHHPGRAPSLQNRLRPIGWNEVLDSVATNMPGMLSQEYEPESHRPCTYFYGS